MTSTERRRPNSTACEQIGPEAACGYGRNIKLVASYPMTAGEVTRWQEQRGDQFPNLAYDAMCSLPPTAPVTVCYFHGTGFVFPRPDRAPYRALILLVQPTGETTLDCAGPETMRFGSPESVPRGPRPARLVKGEK
jgi:hypothetical protein